MVETDQSQPPIVLTSTMTVRWKPPVMKTGGWAPYAFVTMSKLVGHNVPGKGAGLAGEYHLHKHELATTGSSSVTGGLHSGTGGETATMLLDPYLDELSGLHEEMLKA
ncbi:hypothetical protein EMCRGX_G010690 [Ephydatia muelleri]